MSCRFSASTRRELLCQFPHIRTSVCSYFDTHGCGSCYHDTCHRLSLPPVENFPASVPSEYLLGNLERNEQSPALA